MLISEFLEKLSNKNLLKNEEITLKFDIFETTLQKIKITRFSDGTYQITMIDELLPIKTFDYNKLSFVKNKIKMIHEDSQKRHWKTLNIKEIIKEKAFNY